MPHISTGNLFSYEISNNTSLGLQVKECMAQGQLVSDQIVIDILEKEIKQLKSDSIILDGFPRTNTQAIALGPLLNKHHLKIKQVFFLEVSDDTVEKRITGRRICTNCKTPWHTEYNKPQNTGFCDLCQSKLEQRKDDTTKVVKQRLTIYYQSAKQLQSFYQGKGLLRVINAEQSSKQVFEDIQKILE